MQHFLAIALGLAWVGSEATQAEKPEQATLQPRLEAQLGSRQNRHLHNFMFIPNS